MRVYQVELSSPELTVDIHQRFPDGRSVRVPTKLRNIELEILDACFLKIAGMAKNIPDYLSCIKIAKQMQSLTDTVKSIQFKKTDIENFMNGFTLTAGSRPENWTRCVHFWEEVNAPKEIELEDKPKDTKNG